MEWMIQYLAKNAQNEHYTFDERKQILRYGFKKLLTNLFILMILFTISFFMDTLKVMFILIITFVVLRMKFGGWHSESKGVCITLTIIVPIVYVFIIKAYDLPLIFTFITYLFAYLSAFLKGVVDNPKKELSSDKKSRFKLQGIIILTFIGAIHIFVLSNHLTNISEGMTLSIFTSFINLYFNQTKTQC
ncbi:MAG: accessory gene regulator B family protein [Marinisporobacter sp.]|jgi:accessory gene regulator protein AgrB|nr:accessory gene regulator B family protein [Marinisporobacter sp.]